MDTEEAGGLKPREPQTSLFSSQPTFPWSPNDLQTHCRYKKIQFVLETPKTFSPTSEPTEPTEPKTQITFCLLLRATEAVCCFMTVSVGQTPKPLTDPTDDVRTGWEVEGLIPCSWQVRRVRLDHQGVSRLSQIETQQVWSCDASDCENISPHWSDATGRRSASCTATSEQSRRWDTKTSAVSEQRGREPERSHKTEGRAEGLSKVQARRKVCFCSLMNWAGDLTLQFPLCRKQQEQTRHSTSLRINTWSHSCSWQVKLQVGSVTLFCRSTRWEVWSLSCSWCRRGPESMAS